VLGEVDGDAVWVLVPERPHLLLGLVVQQRRLLVQRLVDLGLLLPLTFEHYYISIINPINS
jgi:hypothetical protein